MKNNGLFQNQSKFLEFCLSINEKQDFKNDYELLYKFGVLYDLYKISSKEINNFIKYQLDGEIQNINSHTIKRLLESAFLFASLSSEIGFYGENIDEKETNIEQIDNLKNKAYRIVVSIYYYGLYIRDNNIENGFFDNNIIIYRLFTRLGILTDARNKNIENIDIFSLDLHGKIEDIQKSNKNRLSIKEQLEEQFQKKEVNLDLQFNDEFVLSDYQNHIIEILLGNTTENGATLKKSLVISGPTSSGKTFIIKRYLIHKILEHYLIKSPINIVFIVPTKALINELKNDFLQLFQEYKITNDICTIHSYLSADEYEEYKKNSNLFLFTQERMNYFYNEIKDNNKTLKIESIVIDEAHKVGYGYRGTLLKYLINNIKNDNKGVQILLLAPFLKKLSKFSKEFGIQNFEYAFSKFSLVANNEIFVERVQPNGEGSKRFLEFNLKIGGNTVNILKIKVPENKMGTQDKILSYLALNFSENEQSIVYRNGPGNVKTEAEKIAEKLVEYDKTQLQDLIGYLNDILPNNFPLTRFLEKGVAYHNGRLPTSIKSNIEESFKDNKLKYLCANNTILEGVNLPAKNIFIGHDADASYVNKLDFLNLIGRTGRLNYHFTGNIFYTDAEKYIEKISKTDSDLEEITHNIGNILDDINKNKEGKTKFDRFLDYIAPGSFLYKNVANDREEKEESQDFEYLLGYIIAQIIEKDIGDKKESGNQLKIKNIREIIGHRDNIIDDKDNIFNQIGEFIYEYGNKKVEKIEKLRNYILAIYNDGLNKRSNNDEDFLKIIKKNIFIDPRKQIDFYELVKRGEDGFVKENITHYAKAIAFLSKSTIVQRNIYTSREGEQIEYNSSQSDIDIETLFNIVSNFFIKKVNSLYGDQERLCKKILKKRLYGVSLKNIIISNKDTKPDEIFRIINDKIQFDLINAFTIFFDLANLGYKKYMEEINPDMEMEETEQFNYNFISYLELGSFYPNIVYLISKGVSRESAIYLKEQKVIDPFLSFGNSEEYFNANKKKILNYLEKNNKNLLLEELQIFIYNS